MSRSCAVDPFLLDIPFWSLLRTSENLFRGGAGLGRKEAPERIGLNVNFKIT